MILPCPASGFISPHSPCLLCCPTRDFFQFFRSVVLPSSSTSSFMLFLRPEAVFLSCLLYLIHSSTHFLFWYRHHLLLEAPPDPLFLSWIKYLPSSGSSLSASGSFTGASTSLGFLRPSVPDRTLPSSPVYVFSPPRRSHPVHAPTLPGCLYLQF